MSGNWVRESRRWAIYLRDGLHCIYCGVTAHELAHSAQGFLTLDHIRGRKGHEETNLVTACYDCNVDKGRKSLQAWCRESDWSYSAVRNRVQRTTCKPVKPYLHAARVLLGEIDGIPPADLVILMKWRARTRWAGPAEQGDWTRLDLQPCQTCGRVPDVAAQPLQSAPDPF